MATQLTYPEQSEPSEAIDLQFPNAIVLDYDYYDDDRYNAIRRCKLMLFSQCLGKTCLAELEGNIVKTQKKLLITYLTKFGLSKNSSKCVAAYAYPFIYTKEYIVKNLERGCLNRTIVKSNDYNIRGVWSNPKFVSLYHDICYKIASNLDVTSVINSDYITKKILKNEVNINMVANMSSKELCPKKYEKIDMKINQRTNLERKIKYSELYRCRKCKRNQCTTERRYNRSLDEGVNLTIICLFCGHEWCG